MSRRLSQDEWMRDLGRGVRSASDALLGQCEDARNDLERLDIVLSEAIGKLLESFHSISENAKRQHGLARRLAFETRSGATLIGPLERVARECDDSVGRAVTALQFQDMASQVIAHARQRWRDAQGTSMERREMAQALDGGNPAEAGIAFERLQRSADAMVERGGQMPVNHKQFDAGSVELF